MTLQHDDGVDPGAAIARCEQPHEAKRCSRPVDRAEPAADRGRSVPPGVGECLEELVGIRRGCRRCYHEDVVDDLPTENVVGDAGGPFAGQFVVESLHGFGAGLHPRGE